MVSVRQFLTAFRKKPSWLRINTVINDFCQTLRILMNKRWKMNISPGKADRINRLVGEMSLETFKLHVQITVRVL